MSEFFRVKWRTKLIIFLKFNCFVQFVHTTHKTDIYERENKVTTKIAILNYFIFKFPIIFLYIKESLNPINPEVSTKMTQQHSLMVNTVQKLQAAMVHHQLINKNPQTKFSHPYPNQISSKQFQLNP